MKSVALTVRGVVLISSLVLGTALPARATIYNDGGTHTISGTDSNDSISNGTTVNVVTGATVTGASIDPFGTTAIGVSGSTSALNASGGTITGGSGSHFGADGVNGTAGNFNFSAGSFNGGSSSGTSSGEVGGNGADFSGYTSLTISGGTYVGGSGFTGQGGYGLLLTGGSAPATISGGVFNGSGGALHLSGSSVADISNVQLSNNSLSDGSSVANVSGNVNNPPLGQVVWSFEGNSELNVSAGIFSNVANFYNNARGDITGGQLYGTTLSDSSIVTFSGGILQREVTVLDNSVFNLTGGTINTFTPTFYLGNSGVLNVYGTDLAFSQGILSGYLSDGTPIPAFTQIEIFNSAVVNLIETPEPGTLALAALGMLGLAGYGYRRRWQSA